MAAERKNFAARARLQWISMRGCGRCVEAECGPPSYAHEALVGLGASRSRSNGAAYGDRGALGRAR